MNFKIIDLENIVSTLMEMRTGIFVLATIAGIHTLSLLCWFGYNWANGETKEETKEEPKEPKEPKEVDDMLDMEPIENENENENGNEEIEIIDNEKETIEELELIRYNKMLILKRKLNELNDIANMVLKITNKLEITKDELSELNNRPN